MSSKLAIVYADSITIDDSDEDFDGIVSDISRNYDDQNIIECDDRQKPMISDNVSRILGHSRPSVSRSKRESGFILASSGMKTNRILLKDQYNTNFSLKGSSDEDSQSSTIHQNFDEVISESSIHDSKINRPGDSILRNIKTTTVRSMPWLQTPMTSNRSKSQPKKKEQVVIDHLFDEYSKNTDDPFWENLLKNCSYGKMPQGTFFRKNVLTFRRGTQSFSEEIDPDPATGAIQCIGFFRKHCDLKSEKDVTKINIRIERSNRCIKKISQMTWKQIKDIKTKKALILDYIYKLKHERDLSTDQLNDLKTKVKMGMSLGLFSHDNIIFDKGVIIDIVGLKWDFNKEEFYIDKSLTKEYKAPRTKNLMSQEMYLNPNYKVIAKGSYVDYGKVWEKMTKKFP